MAPISGVHTTCWGMEYSVHLCPKQYRKEVQSIFAGVDLADMLIVPTCQHSGMDLVNVGDKVDGEKDRLLERFVAWSSRICEKLIATGNWADYIDPCSGLPMIHSDNNQVYGEVQSLGVLLGYKYVPFSIVQYPRLFVRYMQYLGSPSLLVNVARASAGLPCTSGGSV
jgi:hypothetical protein